VLASQVNPTACALLEVLGELPDNAIFSGEFAALLVIVSVPLALPEAFGSKFTVNVFDSSGVSVCAPPDPFKLKPVPETVTLEILALEFPEFVTFTLAEPALPTFTLPKLSVVALALNVTDAVVPLPVSGMFAGDPDALLTTATAPVTVDALVGLNCAVNVVLCPAATVKGNVIPDTLIPDPDTLNPEIVIDEDPPSASRIVCVTSLPTVTVPKFTDAGVTLRADAVPVPVQSTVTGEPFALLAIVIAPDSAAAVVGLNTTVTSAFCPGCKVEGIARPVSVTPVPLIAALEIVTAAVPVFDNFTISVDVLPIEISPKLIADGVAVSAAVALFPLNAIFVGELSALLLIVSVPLAEPLDAVYVTSSESVPPGFNVAGTIIPPIVNPLPETVTEVTVRFAVPSFVIMIFCVVLVPTLTFPKLIAAGDTLNATEPAPPTAPFPVTPTQPEVISSATASVAVRNVCRQNDAGCCFTGSTRCGTATLQMETRLMTTAIVRCAV
jgi:hypothetical protein